MNITLEDVEAYLSTVEELLVAEGMRDASEILRIANVLPQETGYDNWNGGTTIWTIYLRLEPGIYARLGTKHETIEKQINERLKTVLDQFTEDWYSAKIVPYVNPQARRHSLKPRGVSTNTRQNILDGLRIEGVLWRAISAVGNGAWSKASGPGLKIFSPRILRSHAGLREGLKLLRGN